MSKKIQDKITKVYIDLLEQGVIPWRKPWREYPQISGQSGKAYSGSNAMLLNAIQEHSGFACNVWLTYKQAKKLNGSVNKGEHGSPIIFYERRKGERENKQGETEEYFYPVLRCFTVFNLEQTTLSLVDLPYEEIETPLIYGPELPPDMACNDFIENMPEQPKFITGGNSACYVPATDEIHLPVKNAFNSCADYYHTMMHEVGHWTGSETRLSRVGVVNASKFSGHQYSFEELVAEIFASIVMSDLNSNYFEDTIENSASYIQSWIKVLSNNSDWIIQAASKATKAYEWCTK